MTEAIGKEILENGLAIEWAWCPEVESPRAWEDNLGHMLTWSRGCDSPDENPWADPADFVADTLRERFAFAELHEAVSAGRLGSLRFEADEHGQERLLAWYRSMITGRAGWDVVDDYDGCRDKEALARAIAECAEAPCLLQEKIVLKTVYRMEHSSVTYSTGGFGDPWDSGAVGFIYADADDAERFGIPATDSERIAKILDEEVERYSEWANGETYMVALRDAEGGVIDLVGGYIGDEDLRLGIEDMRGIALSAA